MPLRCPKCGSLKADAGSKPRVALVTYTCDNCGYQGPFKEEESFFSRIKRLFRR